MRNFTLFLAIPLFLFSCSKQHVNPGSNPGNPVVPPPARPVTEVMITVNDTIMHYTSLSFARQGSGTGGGMTITASNDVQKVTAEAFNFYQQNAWNMMYTQEVSYFTRSESPGDWGAGYTRPVPRDDEIRFDNFTPLTDSVVTGYFSGSFNGGSGVVKEGQVIKVRGSFKLVFK